MIEASLNLGAKALRRLSAAHKPFTRLMRRRARAREELAFAEEAAAVERELAAVAAAAGPILAGPWLAEVGYETLYWVPFLRWWRDAFRVPSERIIAVSRGGVADWYAGIAGRYIDILDHVSPDELAAANDERQRREEGGGRKQSAPGELDARIIERIQSRHPAAGGAVLHPSLMFRLFRHAWHGNLPMEFFWRRTSYVRLAKPPRPALSDLPRDYIAVKFYTGPALPESAANHEALRALVQQAAAAAPVIVLETGVALDDHRDYAFAGLRNVISARPWMTARDNLALQTALIAHARWFLGTCGGLAWMAPFMDVPTIGVYADDRQLAPHLFVARQALRRLGGAEFSLLDLRAVGRLGFPAVGGRGPDGSPLPQAPATGDPVERIRC